MADGSLNRTANFVGWVGLVKSIDKAVATAAELNKDIQKKNSPNFEKKGKGVDFGKYYVERLIREVKEKAEDQKLRDIVQTPWKRDGSPNASVRGYDKFKLYPDEPLNPRISKARAVFGLGDNNIRLIMVVDGKLKSFDISDKNTVAAFKTGVLPLNVLANKALNVSENMQSDLSSMFERNLDRLRGQEQERETGLRR